MKEFVINEYIVLRFLNQETRIYIADQLFNCTGMHLVLHLKKSSFKLRGIKCIDDISEILVNSLSEEEFNEIYEHEYSAISPEEEFWGYCSNIQVWAENNYNTNFLYHKIAFPLLKLLVKAGDPIASLVYKREIIKRFINGSGFVQAYLFHEGYLDNLHHEEVINAIKKLSKERQGLIQLTLAPRFFGGDISGNSKELLKKIKREFPFRETNSLS